MMYPFTEESVGASWDVTRKESNHVGGVTSVPPRANTAKQHTHMMEVLMAELDTPHTPLERHKSFMEDKTVEPKAVIRENKALQ